MKIQVSYCEVDIAQHCNLRCLHCAHYSPYLPPGFYDLRQFEADVAKLAGVYHARMMRLLGGEPLLNGDLPQYVEIVRRHGLADVVGICTNGILLAQVPDGLLRGLDFIHVSLYPLGGKFLQDMENASAKCRRLGIRLSIEKKDTCRLMNVDRPHDEELSRKIYHSCKIAHLWRCHIIQGGYFYQCSRPISISEYFACRGVQSGVDYRGRDGVALHEARLFERLYVYLVTRRPLLACSYCLGTAGKNVPWRPMDRESETARPLHPMDWLLESELEKVYI